MQKPIELWAKCLSPTQQSEVGEMEIWKALNMNGFFSAVSEMGALLYPIPNEKVCVYQTEFPLPKEIQLESTAFSINN